MLKKLSRFLRLTTQLLVYSYCSFLLIYFLLRLIFWDRLWIVAFIGSFIPLILLPIFLLPLPAFFLIKKPWFSIPSSIACLWLLGWLHLTYFSPQITANIKEKIIGYSHLIPFSSSSSHDSYPIKATTSFSP